MWKGAIQSDSWLVPIQLVPMPFLHRAFNILTLFSSLLKVTFEFSFPSLFLSYHDYFLGYEHSSSLTLLGLLLTALRTLTLDSKMLLQWEHVFC